MLQIDNQIQSNFSRFLNLWASKIQPGFPFKLISAYMFKEKKSN